MALKDSFSMEKEFGVRQTAVFVEDLEEVLEVLEEVRQERLQAVDEVELRDYEPDNLYNDLKKQNR